MLNSKIGTLVPLTKSKEEPPNSTAARNILGVNVDVCSKRSALAQVAKFIATNHHQKIAFLNAHGANVAWSDAEYVNTMSNFMVLADGIGVDMGSMINYGSKFPDNLNGTDFVPSLLAYLNPGIKIGLLGAAPGVAESAVKKLQSDYPAHIFYVVSHGFFSSTEGTEILAGLKKSRPDILLVALGNPAQENWIAKNCTHEHCIVAMGVGAYLDFAAGRVPRAPFILRKLRIEWAYRLWLEPARMWKRYMVGNPMFLLRSFLQKFGRSPYK